ncbi:tetratricopeptide repeat protein [Saccharicrinis sp. FJH54]|uniref:tetratricopeptide repeat protein n=1 Tax=Saccharicrinis sp. FJH54 TaxID=3344665 RepID=UPI0035D4A4DD
MHQKQFNQDGNHNNDVVSRYEDMLFQQKIGYFDVEEFESLTEYYLNHMKVKKSLIVVEEGLKQHPGSTSLFLWKARVLHKMGKYNTALGIIEKLSFKIYDEEVLMLEGELLLRMDKFQAANDVFENLLKTSDDEIDRMCLDIAFLYMGIQQPNVALYYLKKGLMHNPFNIDLLFELALNSEENGKSDLAITYLNQLLDVDPYNEEAWYNMGMSHNSNEDYDKAVEAFDYALVIDPGFYNAIFQKGIALLRQDKYQEALDSFQQFLKTETHNEEVLIYLAECYEGLGDYVSAEQTYYSILEAEPEVYDAWIGLGFCKQSTKDYIESVNCFKKALEMDETDDEAWTGMAESYFYSGFKREASEAFTRSLKLNPEQEDVWVMLIALRIENNELEEARSALSMAISIIGDNESLLELKRLLDILVNGEYAKIQVATESGADLKFKGDRFNMVDLSKFIDPDQLKN